MSDHVSRALLLSAEPLNPTNDASVSRPQEARTRLWKGTVTWCVASCTESILPAGVPQNTYMSAARATPESSVSMSRCGTLPTVEYPCGWKISSVSFPGSMMRPAFRLVFEIPVKPAMPTVHVPVLGAHTLMFGSGACSLDVVIVPPVPASHQRGPLRDELAGSPLAWPRPQPVIRQVPGTVGPVLP